MNSRASRSGLSRMATCCAAAILASFAVHCGGSRSDDAAAPVPAAPSITSQPSGQTVVANGSVTFRVEATGYPAPGVQWEKNGREIPGATSQDLVLDNVPITDDGALYDAIVHNEVGNVTSSAVTLNVKAPAGSYVVKFTCAPQAGGLSGDTIQLVAGGGETTPVVAHTPVRGFSDFVNWTSSTGATSTSTTLVATGVDADQTWKANFIGSDIGCQGYDMPGLDADGKAVAMSDFKGHVILLNVAAQAFDGDKGSENVAPLVEALYQKFKDKGLAALTVLTQNANNEKPDPSELKAWADAFKLTCRVQNDMSSTSVLYAISCSYYATNPSSYSYPTTVVLDQDFVVQYIAAGFDEKAITAVVQRLLDR